jgi:HEAT repeat protein
MRLKTFLAAIGLAALAFSLAPADAEAQRAPTKRTPRRQAQAAEPREGVGDEPAAPLPTMADLPQLVERLRGTPDEARAALDQLVILDRREAIEPIAALLRAGQPDAITDHALASLERIAEPSSIDVLTEFTRHRRAGARRRAYEALAEIEDRRVAPLLEQGLRDSDRSVRAAAADSLGDIGARGSLDILFRAFERGVIEAAPAIGKLGDERSVARFTEHLGQQPLSVMLDGYAEYLHRADIADATKIEIVVRLGEVSGRLVRQFLQQEIARLQEQERGRRRRTPSPLVMRMSEVMSRIPADGETRRTREVGTGEGAGATTPAAGGAQ